MVADNFICGGTLIEYDIVLTAAHCLLGRSIDAYKVVLGEYDRSISEGVEQFIEVSAFKVHPEFQGNFLGGYDVALLYLARNASENQGVQTINIAEPDDLISAKKSKHGCFITGWGVKSVEPNRKEPCPKSGRRGEELADKLQEADIELISNKKCNSKRYWNGLVKVTNLCAFYKDTAACEGDSGSPLVCLCGGSYVLVGTTSWGSSTCRNYPTVFTNVSKVRIWVKTMIKALRDTDHSETSTPFI
ncbi:chymotrypsin-like elastase family member 1 [Ostrea edulis]|uniref:chymotrypsin-like elastase family member 1 n=1 Tax=Ostrea edulis TaxID=37623 RepID=UPI0024AF2C66|nr:chymotrypsin-like elastase family member 1 [Ostrea edulis]